VLVQVFTRGSKVYSIPFSNRSCPAEKRGKKEVEKGGGLVTPTGLDIHGRVRERVRYLRKDLLDRPRGVVGTRKKRDAKNLGLRKGTNRLEESLAGGNLFTSIHEERSLR